MPTESALLGVLKLVQRDDSPSDLEQHRKEHAQAAIIARTTFVLLHVFILATLFTCGSDLQHSLQGGHRLYLGGFLALLLASAALYVALNLSDPGYLEPRKGQYSGTDIEEGKEALPLTNATSNRCSKGVQNSGRGRRSSQRPFDLGRLLAAEMGADDLDDSQAGSQYQSESEDAVSLPGSAGKFPAEQKDDGALQMASQGVVCAPLDAANKEIAPQQRQLSAGGADSAGQALGQVPGSWRGSFKEAGPEPDSWRSWLHAPDQAGHSSEGGVPMGGGDTLGGWADVLPAGGSLPPQRGAHILPDLAPGGVALAAYRSEGSIEPGGPSSEGIGSQQNFAGSLRSAEAGSSDFLIGAVHHGCRGLSEDSRSSSRTVAWFERALPGRPCEWCGAWQRLRAHHCALCDRCVAAYDHHCAWIGTCVGAHNRPMFVGFLATQTALLAWALQAAVSCLRNAAPLMPDSAFFGYDWEVVASIGLLAFLLTFVACLLGYQLFLAATAQTTREHSCSNQVAYLAHVPAHVHPFSRGLLGNLWDFAFENADREWNLPSIEEMVMREHAQPEGHCC